MSEQYTSEDWSQYREEQKKRRADRLPIRIAEIMELENVVKLTEYQYRVNGWIDLYPTHRRYHVLHNNKRGNYYIKDRKIFKGIHELKMKP